MRKLAAILACTTLLAGAAHAQSIKKLDPALDKVIAPGTKIEKVATGFLFIEGPMWRDGKLWFSDVKGDKVRTFDPKTKAVTVVLKDSGGVKDASPDFRSIRRSFGPKCTVSAVAVLSVMTDRSERMTRRISPRRVA